MNKPPTSLALVDRYLAQRSLADFSRMFWEVLEPTTPMLWCWAQDVICEHLEAVSRGDILRLIINGPPRSMKSILTSVFWPAWSWATHPETRWLFASYAFNLALKHSRDRRAVITSDAYRKNWEH
jgi:hypothetical protein